MANVPAIRKLDESVINRIAAGEIIQRPVSAIKEMIENSLDAKSTVIQITVKEGGLKFLQLLDNGCGIRKEDMGIVCERFTTSKLCTFEDLNKIATYGFRGEALASISHVAHVTITTKTAQSSCAYKAQYSDGKPKQEPKPCAGNRGTQITVEDLFYNMLTRRKALKNAGEEYAKIVDVVGKYAIHNSGVAFTVKKHGQSLGDVRTLNKSSITENIATIYGASVAKELLEISCNNEHYGFKMKGYITNANYSMKRLIFLLFINHRLVDSSAIRKAIDLVYSAYLPKGTHPFVYLSLDIHPSNVDVNVHPTKHEVHFLHEDSIIEIIQKNFEDKLLGCNSSRTYYTQKLLPTTIVASDDVTKGDASSTSSQKSNQRVYDHHLVRTDSREQTLHAFIKPQSSYSFTTIMTMPKWSRWQRKNVLSRLTCVQGTRPTKIMEDNDYMENRRGTCAFYNCSNEAREQDDGGSRSQNQVAENDTAMEISDSSEPCNKAKSPPSLRSQRREISLTSVIEVCDEIDKAEHKDLTDIFQNHKFVGCVDRSTALMQHGTKLYLTNVTSLSQELFYQILFFSFGNFGHIRLNPPAAIAELTLLALNSPGSGWSPEDGPKEELAEYIVKLFKEKSDMLEDYFSMVVDQDGNLESLPLLLDDYLPNLDGIPMFVLRLATEVDWESEKTCFQTFAKECSYFYAFKAHPNVGKEENDKNDDDKSWKWMVEHVLFPAFRCGLVPPKRLAEDGTLLQVANLPDLYKVFERC